MIILTLCGKILHGAHNLGWLKTILYFFHFQVISLLVIFSPSFFTDGLVAHSSLVQVYNVVSEVSFDSSILLPMAKVRNRRNWFCGLNQFLQILLKSLRSGVSVTDWLTEICMPMWETDYNLCYAQFRLACRESNDYFSDIQINL